MKKFSLLAVLLLLLVGFASEAFAQDAKPPIPRVSDAIKFLKDLGWEMNPKEGTGWTLECLDGVNPAEKVLNAAKKKVLANNNATSGGTVSYSDVRYARDAKWTCIALKDVEVIKLVNAQDRITKGSRPFGEWYHCDNSSKENNSMTWLQCLVTCYFQKELPKDDELRFLKEETGRQVSIIRKESDETFACYVLVAPKDKPVLWPVPSLGTTTSTPTDKK